MDQFRLQFQEESIIYLWAKESEHWTRIRKTCFIASSLYPPSIYCSHTNQQGSYFQHENKDSLISTTFPESLIDFIFLYLFDQGLIEKILENLSSTEGI